MAICQASFRIFEPASCPTGNNSDGKERPLQNSCLTVEVDGNEPIFQSTSDRSGDLSVSKNEETHVVSPVEHEIEREVYPEVIDPNAPDAKEMDDLILFLEVAQKRAYQYFGTLMAHEGHNGGGAATAVAHANHFVLERGKQFISPMEKDLMSSERDKEEDQEMSSLDSSS